MLLLFFCRCFYQSKMLSCDSVRSFINNFLTPYSINIGTEPKIARSTLQMLPWYFFSTNKNKFTDVGTSYSFYKNLCRCESCERMVCMRTGVSFKVDACHLSCVTDCKIGFLFLLLSAHRRRTPFVLIKPINLPHYI